jgi:hypothetical protein
MAEADDTNLAPFLCHFFRDPTPPLLGQCLQSLNVDSGTVMRDVGGTGPGSGQSSTDYDVIDGTGHVVAFEIVTEPGPFTLYCTLRFPDGTGARTLVVPPGSTGGSMDLSGDNFYYLHDPGSGGLSLNFDEECGAF